MKWRFYSIWEEGMILVFKYFYERSGLNGDKNSFHTVADYLLLNLF